jgi:hypothetical protein
MGFKEFLTEELGNIRFAYHWTSKANAQSIRENGFTIQKGGLYGPAVYLSPSKTLYKQYGSGIRLKVEILGSLNIFRVTTPESSDRAIYHWRELRNDYDAVFAGSVGHESELAIFDPTKLKVV